MTVRVMVGDVRAQLERIPAASIHCIWTSPPYWGLRAYQTEPQIWGGDLLCFHAWGEHLKKPRDGAGRHGETSMLIRQSRSVTESQVSGSQATKGQMCRHCGAWRGEHGLEPTLEMWLANEVTIWQGLRRVLRNDGTAWLNCGDAYATASSKGGPPSSKSTLQGNGHIGGGPKAKSLNHVLGGHSGLASKQRLMLPARLALAIQADGWWLRDEVVWAKRNPMPSSVDDRTTPAHEMLYMFSKRSRYYYDAVANMETASRDSHARAARTKFPSGWDSGLGRDHTSIHRLGRGPGVSPKAAQINGTGKGHPKSNASFNAALGTSHVVALRNKRSVWWLASEPFPEAHFATAPTALVEPCILASTSERGVCPDCGAPWKRQIKRKRQVNRPGPTKQLAMDARGRGANERQALSSTMEHAAEIQTIGWKATCDHGKEPVPATVLDCFGGSGTTALVADRLGRDAILIELKPDYAEMSLGRVGGETPMFTKVAICS